MRIARTEVKAPVAGLVSRRTARLGATVSSVGEPLFRIIRDGAVDLEADVPEQSLARLAVGMPAKLRLPGVAEEADGVVRLVSEEVDKASRTGKARIALAAGAPARIGSFASGEIEIARGQGVGVPASAVQREAAGARVLVVRDGIVELRRVSRSGIAEGDALEIVSGVAAGETRRGARGRVPARGRPRARGHAGRRRPGSRAMRINVSAWSIRRPIPAIVAFAVLTLLGIVSFRQMAITKFPNIDIPIVEIVDHPVGRGALGAGVAGHQEGRGRGLERQRRLAHDLDGDRRRLGDRRPVQRRLGRHRPRAQRREGPDREDPQPICRARSTSRSSAASTSKACRSSPTPPRRRG